MSRILLKHSGKQLVTVAGYCLLALIVAPLAAQETDAPLAADEPDAPRAADEPRDVRPLSQWGPVSLAGKFGSFEADLIARLFARGLYSEINYGESDLDLPANLGGTNIDVNYWSLGLRWYPLVYHEVGGFDFAFYAGGAIGVYDLDSPLGPLTGSKSGFSVRAGLEVRYSELPQLGVELQWASHEIDLPGSDLEFDGFLIGARFHFGIGRFE